MHKVTVVLTGGAQFELSFETLPEFNSGVVRAPSAIDWESATPRSAYLDTSDIVAVLVHDPEPRQPASGPPTVDFDRVWASVADDGNWTAEAKSGNLSVRARGTEGESRDQVIWEAIDGILQVRGLSQSPTARNRATAARIRNRDRMKAKT